MSSRIQRQLSFDYRQAPVKGSRAKTYAIPGARARILNVHVGYLPHFGEKNLTGKEAGMSTIDNGKNLGSRLDAYKAKFYDLTWTGLYGKEPWPRERKQWEKI